VSSRKRNARRRKTQRQGVSGNPQRRAQQLRQDRGAGQDQLAFRRVQADPGRAAFRELAYRLAGGASAEAWWRESHERILARARALAWPSRLVDLETQACQIVGDEFCDRLRSPGAGLHPVQWLRALAEETGAALRAALAQGADDWQKLWALLCGLALTAPWAPAGPVSETARGVGQEFPDIKDPHETTLAEADKAARLLASLGLEPGAGCPRLVRQPLLAHRPVQLRRRRTGSLVCLGHRRVLGRRRRRRWRVRLGRGRAV
jgi:hypothetical protein